MLPVLKLDAAGEIQLKDAVEALSGQFNPTPEEQQQLLPSGTMTTIRNRVAWAVSYLVQAKLLNRPSLGVHHLGQPQRRGFFHALHGPDQAKTGD